MAKIRIFHDGNCTQIEVDGVILQEVTGITLKFPIDGVAEAHVTMNMEAPIDVSVDGDVITTPSDCGKIDVTMDQDLFFRCKACGLLHLV